LFAEIGRGRGVTGEEDEDEDDDDVFNGLRFSNSTGETCAPPKNAFFARTFEPIHSDGERGCSFARSPHFPATCKLEVSLSIDLSCLSVVMIRFGPTSCALFIAQV
jgi:hypothetical protein